MTLKDAIVTQDGIVLKGYQRSRTTKKRQWLLRNRHLWDPWFPVDPRTPVNFDDYQEKFMNMAKLMKAEGLYSIRTDNRNIGITISNILRRIRYLEWTQI